MQNRTDHAHVHEHTHTPMHNSRKLVKYAYYLIYSYIDGLPFVLLRLYLFFFLLMTLPLLPLLLLLLSNCFLFPFFLVISRFKWFVFLHTITN